MTCLIAAHSQVLIIDIQERLAPAIPDAAAVIKATQLIGAAAQRLNVTVTVTEQYPKGLGATREEVRASLPENAAILPKMYFSAWRDQAIADRLKRLDRSSLIIMGMEAHVCVLQTVIDARVAGFDVSLVTDAVASRAPHNHAIALRRMEKEGIRLVTAEMVVFEWLDRAGTDDFKAIAPLLK